MKRLALFICTLLCVNLLIAQSFTIGDLRYKVENYSDGTTGVVVGAADSNAREINIESLPSGAYYLRLTNNDKAIMRKVIKE
jgi:hypothetical protein